jgi:Tfp pilus assembly protein FimT
LLFIKTIKNLGSGRGFSLIEAVIVLFLIGLISTTLVRPKISGLFATSALKATSVQLELDLKVARNQALQTNLLYKTVLGSNTENYTIYSQHPTQNVWEIFKAGTFEVDSVKILSNSFANNQVIFGTDGTPYEDSQSDLPTASTDIAVSATRNIVLQYNSNQTKTIYIIPDTGFITRTLP